MASHTRFSSALAAIFLLSLPACGDSTSTTTATTAGTTDLSGPSTATETTADTTTTTTATTDNPTSTATTGPTTSTATTAPETTTSTGPTTETTGVSASTSETGETTSAGTTETTANTTDETTTSETTGEPVGATCEQDSDCQIFTDCCTCDVLAVGEQPPACNVPECFVEACAVLDIGAPPKAVCRFGRCTFEKVTCNPVGVTCNMSPPDCPVGQLPSVEGECWSGQCTPVEACDWAPDCAACTTDPHDPLVCVLKGQKGAYNVCEPKPVECGDMADIDCECGQEICDAMPPHTVCNDMTPGIVCQCPFC